MSNFQPPRHLLQSTLRVALSYYVTNGLSCAFGLLLISAVVHGWLGPAAAASAGVGVIVCTPPDLAAPRRGKFWQVLPAVLFAIPLFLAVQALHAAPLRLGLLLVPASFLAFLGAAWGKRGLPLAVSAMFAMVFSMAVPVQPGWAPVLETSLHFAIGAVLYLVYAVVANSLLNPRYRVLIIADTLLTVADLMRTQASQFRALEAGERTPRHPLVGRLLQQQAALADHLQAARDLVLEAPRTVRRQQLAGMLLQILEMRDHLLASELDLAELRALPGYAPVLDGVRELLAALAERNARLADSLLLGRQPDAFSGCDGALAALSAQVDTLAPDAAGGAQTVALARGLLRRIGNIHDETSRLVGLARGDAQPDLELVQATWRMFVSPANWSWRPFLALWHWDAPPLRHALRAALAIGTAYLISSWLPWGTHDYWILLTIVVVLRGSLAQTLERRNSRVGGTVLGCLIAGLLLHLKLSLPALLGVVTLAQGIAHAFSARRYLVTAVAATVLALIQAHQLNAAISPTFQVLERLADTLLGAGIAWAFAYVLPSWERHQIPQLVRRSLNAQARHAEVALALISRGDGDRRPELEWRLARRETYDSLSALVQATQRSLSEPRAVRPPLPALGRLLAHSYQLLAQLTSVKTLILLRGDRLDPDRVHEPLRATAANIGAALTTAELPDSGRGEGEADALGSVPPEESLTGDLSPWLLRRLDLAEDIAWRLRRDARRVLDAPAAS